MGLDNCGWVLFILVFLMKYFNYIFLYILATEDLLEIYLVKEVSFFKSSPLWAYLIDYNSIETFDRNKRLVEG